MTFHHTLMAATLSAALFFSSTSVCPAQKGAGKGKATAPGKSVQHRIDPPHWWVGMQHNEVELLIHSPGLAALEVSTKAPGVIIKAQGRAEHPDYRFVRLLIDATVQAGKIPLIFGNGPQQAVIQYELKARANRPGWPGGLQQSDLIYLLMPDRFANGDPSNDIVPGMNEASIQRDSMFWRHGGDLKGVSDHLDYLEDLGVTALWLNPILENDQPKASYHGYAFTDHYRVDRRFGTNDDFVKLTAQCHAKGMKMVMDVVYNHLGDRHHLYQSLPWSSWVNRHPEGFVRTSYRAPVLSDPYASQRDTKVMTDGWFDHHMPDLNQRDPHLAEYLIQNSIWWIEEAGLDAFRIDTYAYPDLAFMQLLLQRIFKEYPNFGVFGETWVDGVPVQLYFHESNVQGNFRSNLPGVTDFQLYYAILEALGREMGWADGVARLYLTMAADYLHKDPTRNVVFLDNHDISRFYSMVGEDYRKFQMGMVWLMTVRGTPQLYYGTEILMKNYADPDGKVRADFPGGWAGDKVNCFKPEGRTGPAADAHAFVRTLGRWRKGAQAIHSGKTVQFVPEKGVYVYFRISEKHRVMVAMNCSAQAHDIDFSRYAECYGEQREWKDVLSGESVKLEGNSKMEPWSVRLLEFSR